MSVPAIEYHFFTENAGTRAPGQRIAEDKAGNLDLFALNGASIVRDEIIDVATLQMSNPPIIPKPADYLPQLAFTGPVPFAMDGKTLLTYIKPESHALGQMSGGACVPVRAARRGARGRRLNAMVAQELRAACPIRAISSTTR